MTVHSRLFAMVVVTLLLIMVSPRPGRAASDCACRDANHNGSCDPGEAILPQSGWIGPGAVDIRPDSFTIPENCDLMLAGGISKPIQVTAENIFLFGDIIIGGNGGQGVLFIAAADLVVGDVAKPRINWKVPGQNKLIDKLAANTAIAKASIGFKAGHDCLISNAYLEAQPIGGSAMIGMQCARDIYFRNAELYTSGFDIQALTGGIDASNISSQGTTTEIRWCDPELDGTINLPCTISTVEELSSVCDGTVVMVSLSGTGAGVNKIRAVANPGVLAARGDIRLQSDSAAPSSQNLVEARYALTVISEQGDIDLTNAKISNTNNAQSGSKLWLAAGPATVDRYSLGVLKEKFYGGCSQGRDIVYSAGTCMQSPNPINVCGDLVGSGLSGVWPCRTDVVPVTTGGY